VSPNHKRQNFSASNLKSPARVEAVGGRPPAHGKTFFERFFRTMSKSEIGGTAAESDRAGKIALPTSRN
jgi:hypothetical protein